MSVSPSPIWDSADPQRRPPPLPMREDLPLNHIEPTGKLSRTSSVSSLLHRQIHSKSPSQISKINSDEKILETVREISEKMNTIALDLRSLIERSKDNASSLADLRKNIDGTKCDQELVSEIRDMVTSFQKEDNAEGKCLLFEEKMEKIMKFLDTRILTSNVQIQQSLIDINSKLETIEDSQRKLLSNKLEIKNTISCFETLQQNNIEQMEEMYRQKIEMSAELARLDTQISHRKDVLTQLEGRMNSLENRLTEIQLKLNKQREENKKPKKSSVIIKKKIHQPIKCPTTPQNTRHFSLSDIHNRNPSVIALAPSTIMNSPSDYADSVIINEKGKRKTSWSKKVANMMGLSFHHNNKENSVTFSQDSDKPSIQGKQKNDHNAFKSKSTKAFRSFSTRV